MPTSTAILHPTPLDPPDNTEFLTQRSWEARIVAPDPTEIDVAILTALPIECAAVRTLVDDPHPYPAPAGDPNYYYCGTSPSADPERPHGVLIAVLPLDGTKSAAAVVTDLLRSVPTIQALLLSGIAGGIPRPDEPARHVRLGDVVVATRGVVSPDEVRQVDGAQESRQPSGGVPLEILRAVQELRIRTLVEPPPWDRWLSGTGRPVPPVFARPDDDTDVLHVDGVPVSHPPRSASGHVPGSPKIHYGAISSSDRLVRDAAFRDQLARRHDILAVEMEASGALLGAGLRGRPVLVTRGISDYCDSSKSDGWHGWAALVAAAYVRALLGECRVFATHSASHPAAPEEPRRNHRRPATPDLPTLIQLADLLLEIPVISDDRSRQLVIDQLRPSIRGAIRRCPATRLDVIELVRTAFAFANGPEELIAAVERLDGGTAPASHLRPYFLAPSVDLEVIRSMPPRMIGDST